MFWRLRAKFSACVNSTAGAFASSVLWRDIDWGDVERVLIRQHGKLNLPQVRAELKPLLELKGATEALDKLERMLATVERRLRS